LRSAHGIRSKSLSSKDHALFPPLSILDLETMLRLSEWCASEKNPEYVFMHCMRLGVLYSKELD
jgi:hypothetical protein